MKVCSKCKLSKPLDSFSVKNKTNVIKYNSWCKSCFNIYQKNKRSNKCKITIYNDEFLNKVLVLFNQGLGKVKISRILNVHPCKINRAYIKLGIKNSYLTKNKNNTRKTHLITEKYCKLCEKTIPIENFFFYIDKCGRKRIKFICKFHQKIKDKIRLKLRYEKLKNTLKFKKSRNQYIKNKYKTDINFRLKSNISKLLNKYLKRNCKKKAGNTCQNLLGYSIAQLKNHLENLFESWMNWSNWGKYNAKIWDDNDPSTWTWQIDHIVPQSDLPSLIIGDDNFKKCWALENLRPYSAKLNFLDGVYRIRHKK